MTQPFRVTGLETVEDYTATARCDEGFLHVRRLRVRNLRDDGSKSNVYRVDVVDRPRVDAVAVLVWRRGEHGIEFLTRQNLRPAAYYRREKTLIIPDGREHLFCEEIVAGIVELNEEGEAGLKHRAAEEVLEEAGFRVTAEQVELLGHPFFPAPGILSEKIFITHVDVTGLVPEAPQGDGTPMEEGGELRWRDAASFAAALRDGTIQDAKTELAFARFTTRGA